MARRIGPGGVWWASMVALVIAAALLATWAVEREYKAQRDNAAARLRALSDLRVERIEHWLSSQMSLAYFLDDSTLFAQLFNRWTEERDQEAGTTLLNRAAEFRAATDSDSVLLIDSDGQVLAREHGASGNDNQVLVAGMKDAISQGKSVHTSIYRRPDTEFPVRLDVIVPLLKTGSVPHGAMVLRVDAQRALFPLLQVTSLSGDTSESVLWTRAGENVTNLSELREKPTGAARLNEAMATSPLGIARVLRHDAAPGEIEERIDYRGARVLDTVVPIDGTDWWLESKLDVAQVDGAASGSALAIVAVTASLTLFIAIASRMWMQRAALARSLRDQAVQDERVKTLGLLRAIAESASDAIFAKDLDGRFIFCNHATARAMGRTTPDEVLGRGNADLFDAETSARIDAQDALAIAGQRVENTEVIRPMNGPVFTMLATKGPLRDAEGKIIGMIGVARDITERQQLDEELARHRNQLEALVAERTRELQNAARLNRDISDATPARVCYWDRELRCGFANRAYAEGVYSTPERLIGHTVEEIYREHVDQVRPGLEQALTGEQMRFIRERTNPDGSPFIQEVHYVPQRAADGSTAGVYVMAFDVTALKVAEEKLLRMNEALAVSRDAADAANRAKSSFLANMSHEIRTPMNAIIGLTHLMSRDVHDPVQRGRVIKVGDAAQHLLTVINDVLDLSKIEAGKLVLDEAEFTLDSVLTRAVEMVGVRARDKGLELILDPDHLPERLVGDATRLSQILINLMSNAVKFTQQGWVRVRGSVAAEEADRLQVRFEVQDTGPGIPLERQAALFRAFEQGDNSISREHGGTGLGLALSRQLALAMGGEAGAISAPGAGSTFWFTAWLGRAAEAPATSSEIATSGLRALLVDDLPEALTVIGERLQVMGMQVDPHLSGATALRKVQEEMVAGRPYDVLLIDWLMAPMNGIETLNELRHVLGDGTPPSILVTASEDPKIRELAQHARFDAVMIKPITTSALQGTIATVLGKKGSVAGAGSASGSADSARIETLLRARHGGQRILLAEDNPVNREVAEELLHSAGLVVETAWDGARAVELALSRHYDAILMDMQMPVMDGLEATVAIRKQGRAKLPIIAMTANAFAEDRQACLAAGMNDHLAKPMDPALMFGALLRWLPLRPAARPPGTSADGSAASSSASQDSLRERLTVIEGFDLAASLRSVAGQMTALQRVLQRFVESYRHGAIVLIEHDPDPTKARTQWRAACHSLRGALGTIGATGVLQEVQAFEKVVNESASALDAQPMAEALQRSLIAFVARLQAALEG